MHVHVSVEGSGGWGVGSHLFGFSEGSSISTIAVPSELVLGASLSCDSVEGGE